jgi:hypothetical protein
LSHAGRCILTKYVLQSVLIYSMGAHMLPGSVINEIEALIRRFVWGKLNQGRYIAYVAWDRICSEIEKGGFGLQRLTELNKAMLLRVFWTLVTKQYCTWVVLCREKYLGSNLTWWTVSSPPPYNTTYTQLLQIRDKIIHKFTWIIQSGEGVRAVGEP